MIKTETTESHDGHIGVIMAVDGSPAEVGAEMHAIIKGFVHTLLRECVPGKELGMTMFLEKRFAQAVHEAYQEHMQAEQNHDSEQ